MYNMNFGVSSREDVLASFNLGAETLTMRLPLASFVEKTDVANATGVAPEEIAQRPLDKSHATGLALYILQGLIHSAKNNAAKSGQDTTAFDEILERMGDRRHFSLQPIVVNIPCTYEELQPKEIPDPLGDPVAVRISLPMGVVMWVIDGQHRRFAMNMVMDFLQQVLMNRAYPRKASLFPYENKQYEVSPTHLSAWRAVQQYATRCTVSVEAHINLDLEQQRQVFHDLNNLGKKVAAGTSFDFDSSNAINNYIKETLIEGGVLKAEVSEKDITDWAKHDGSVARKDLVAVNSILFLNKTNPKTAIPTHVEHMRTVADRFWSTVSDIPGFGEDQAKLETVAAQPVVLKALAKLAYDFAKGRKANRDHLERLLDGIDEVDFSHSNPMWDYYELKPEERRRKQLPGLEEYVPHDDGNRDLGGRDEAGRMRFGAKHNDIYPIIGDMIRWRLGLPSRHEPTGEHNASAA